MFDSRTAALLQSAPSFNQLDAQELPKILTRQYAELVSARLRGAEPSSNDQEQHWSLGRIADAYEIVASLESDPELRRAAAFVAGTAQQIIARGNASNSQRIANSVITRDGVDAGLTAALLFLIAEQYADANEAAKGIHGHSPIQEFRIVALHIKDLVQGRLKQILDRATRWRKNEEGLAPKKKTVRRLALQALGNALCEGVELLAADLMSMEHPVAETLNFLTAPEAFRKVLEVCSRTKSFDFANNATEITTSYPGPAHLASLLLATGETLSSAALTKLPPPRDTDDKFWKKWLAFRATETPYVWQNHREAIGLGFYDPGISAVLVLPTGAGKTTVSALKIAATLARNKKVVFLAPTHALVEQLTDDLQSIFPKDEFSLDVSNDFDSVLLADASLQDIEVMTPERCLAMLSFSPQSFENVGLLVFDECHLLSPQEGKNRRALESMLCVLTLNAVAPEADMLFLSAMLRNGREFAEWIADLTGRRCIPIDLLWKPCRQVRGVVLYEQDELRNAELKAIVVQHELDQKKEKSSNSLRAQAKRQLRATPYAVWGLQHNWLSLSNDAYFVTAILDESVELSGKTNGTSVHVTPNANQVAAQLAAAAATKDLKTIVFVNTKNDAVGVASSIASMLNDEVTLNDDEAAVWDAIRVEFGDLKHTVFDHKSFGAVPHNAAMLRVERLLSEKLYKRSDGAKVIVATPTLAQGLNLPAQLAILAGDKRMGEQAGERVTMDAHELLNAAARAGRAGHLANGAVLLVPDPVCIFGSTRRLNANVKRKLSSILPEDDRCIDITDPLEVILDRIMQGDVVDREVRYTVNRLAALASAEGSDSSNVTLISRSLGAFIARKRGEEKIYREKIDSLWAEVQESASDQSNKAVLLLASQSGLPLDLLDRLRTRLRKNSQALPTSVGEWIDWTLRWLAHDEDARTELLGEIKEAVLSTTGKKTTAMLDKDAVMGLKDGLSAWISGAPMRDIETKLGGAPDASTKTHRMCPRARTLAATVIPRGLSFVLSVVARMAEEIGLFDSDDSSNEKLIKALSGAVRRGFDTVHKLEFASRNKRILSRVQMHKTYAEVYGYASMDVDDEL
ncbi:DEAD/DEAH box helicase [Janthinobacterium sp. OK676]|uniref:DEAD/DEAH box helicase n=1 Tax=Janthinobacterium sp. OK676 TaxID=1855295 RepID=UPI0008896B59|nr:DEAD/DEAH box helicase [Janthinobacterium sp. OK676]SDN23276.1 DEAD/DEAH box helicase [Janthinobacterium sp. OK676]